MTLKRGSPRGLGNDKSKVKYRNDQDQGTINLFQGMIGNLKLVSQFMIDEVGKQVS